MNVSKLNYYSIEYVRLLMNQMVGSEPIWLGTGIGTQRWIRRGDMLDKGGGWDTCWILNTYSE